MEETTYQQKLDEKKNYWQTHLKQWQQEKITAASYCKQHDLNIHQFKYYQYQLMRILLTRH